ncbi:hypothetical protein SAMN04488117_1232 [Celeribacter baekdonensis]|uniref:Uncharacterized protein n=1 Tax=Celeribacter baekdonensis TaxID=875171 RepID=A0A1G7UJP0_9RHOB|nr:hypothetical protein [Celeribacter baekdonensis]SDG47734.1 hypothetical protein SAMN04488117_1232 [Celeribacter baekdonensis]
MILEVHIPEGIGNIGEEWKEVRDGLRILTSRWQWREDHAGDNKLLPVRQTLRPGQPARYDHGELQECDAEAFVAGLVQLLREKASLQDWDDACRLGDLKRHAFNLRQGKGVTLPDISMLWALRHKPVIQVYGATL